MIIQIDTREKPQAIEKILKEFDLQEVKYIRSKLYVGDYMNMDNPKLIIDRKQNLTEVCSNVVQQHDRFAKELKKAKDAGIHLIILVEHGANIKELKDVVNWQNPRLKVSPNAVSGERLYKIMKTMAEYYDTEFLFCTKAETGKKIIELLEADKNAINS